MTIKHAPIPPYGSITRIVTLGFPNEEIDEFFRTQELKGFQLRIVQNVPTLLMEGKYAEACVALTAFFKDMTPEVFPVNGA